MNIQILDKALTQITTYPEGWDQDSWIQEAENGCGTTMCLAGHVLIASGEYRQVGLVMDEGGFDAREAVEGETPEDWAFARVGVPYDDDQGVSEGDTAATLLGIDEYEAEHLFYNTCEMTFESPEQFADYVRHYLAGQARVPA